MQVGNMDAIEVVARALARKRGQDPDETFTDVIPKIVGRSPNQAIRLKQIAYPRWKQCLGDAQEVIAALREPAVLEALCRRAIAQRLAGSYDQRGMALLFDLDVQKMEPQVRVAVDLISTVLGAALGEGEHGR